MTELSIFAPLEGWVAPLSETPDPVFAEAMLGDGVALDPLVGELRAPCDGAVASLHRARHAVTVRAANGAEILMHVGLETVALGGEGFVAHVAEGRAVRTGDPLLSFDLDLLARRARSLITPIILANPEAFEIVRRVRDRGVRAGDFLMEIRPLDAKASHGATRDGEAAVSQRVRVRLAHGVHARPAARLVEAARGFDAQVIVSLGQRRGDAASAVGLMSLGAKFGDEVLIEARGPDAARAVAALAALIDGALEEGPAPSPPPSIAPAAPFLSIQDRPADLVGVAAAPGLAIGVAVLLTTRDLEPAPEGRGAATERAALGEALDRIRTRLTTDARAASLAGDRARASILDAHVGLIDDPDLRSAADVEISKGASAGFAWRMATRSAAQTLRNLGDARMAERAADLLDLERRVLGALAGADDEAVVLPHGAVVLADELLPSQLMALDRSRLAGLLTARGGPTSHVAILAAAMELPMVVAAGAGVLAIEPGARLILDADAGQVWAAPDAAALALAETALADRRARRAAALTLAHQACRMADGTRIEVFANLGALADAEAAVASGAEGCGLLRTEFLFLERRSPPDEAEQLDQYQAIATALEGRPLIVRTLDVGGDKAAPYLPIPAEENPALGLRGVRVGLWKPDLLMTQLRAILRVRPQGQCRIMVPMVADLGELRAVRRMLEEAKQALGVDDPVQLGVMVETPAAAVSADLLAAEADFLSIGTNDLTQYVLAMDRGNPEMAPRLDALHPAVLRMIGLTCEGAAKHGRWVGVCGGLASDPLAAPLLIGLGVSELSATVARVPDIKAAVRSLTLDPCRALARRALEQPSPQAVRALVTAFQAGA